MAGAAIRGSVKMLVPLGEAARLRHQGGSLNGGESGQAPSEDVTWHPHPAIPWGE
jgi:hypothetical protein